jgi:hypothetical protein
MNIEKMSDAGAKKTVEEICDGLKQFVENNPEQAKDLLAHMIDDFLDPLAQDDYFGTEGWEVGLGAA